MIKDALDSYLETAHAYRNKLQIILVCNVDGLTKDEENYDGDSITSEYLTLSQYNKILAAMRQEGFEVIPYFDENKFMSDIISGVCANRENKQLLVLNSAQKGTKVGRKSLIPSFCDLHNIWYNNSNAYIVSLCRDKYMSGCLLEYWGFPTPQSWLYKYKNGWLLNKTPLAHERVIIKLNYETSSIGLDKRNIFIYSSAKDSFIKELSDKYHQDVVVQQFISGYEAETTFVNVLEGFSFMPMALKNENGPLNGDSILDYDARKNHPYTFYALDQLMPEVSTKIQVCTLAAGKTLNISGLGRIDYRITEQNKYYITDVATNPGYGDFSSTYEIFLNLGYTYEKMMSILIGITLAKYT